MPQQSVVLITGASSGFGKITASLLSEQGYHVFGTSRKPFGDSVGKFEMLALDVTSDASVNSCIDSLVERTGRLDVLVNNAGYVLHGAIEEITVDEAKSQLETNFWGTVRMVRKVLPIMRRQGTGKIINVASIAGLVGVPFVAFYSASKFALEGYTEALRREVRPFKIHVSLIEPGYFKTGITDSARVAGQSIEAYREMRERWMRAEAEKVEGGSDPRLFAETVLKIIRSPSPKTRYKIGRERWAIRMKPFLPESLFEAGLTRTMKPTS